VFLIEETSHPSTQITVLLASFPFIIQSADDQANDHIFHYRGDRTSAAAAAACIWNSLHPTVTTAATLDSWAHSMGP